MRDVPKMSGAIEMRSKASGVIEVAEKGKKRRKDQSSPRFDT
jgi:hypothetical protein